MMKDNIKKIVKDVLTEATSSSKNSTYVSPLLPGYREFEKHMNGPFTEYVTGWDDPLLDHDSLDGKMSYSKKTIKKREKRAEKIARFIKNNPDSFAWDGDAGVLNGLPGQNTDAKPIKNFDPKKTTVSLDGKTKKSTVKEWVELDGIDLNEDLAVWFGKKKKPKGSNQPKGPWVNICRKVGGKHPPCGRSDTSKGAYPKCRAAGVAGKMSDSEKRSACQQKRRAEKKDTQTGKGQKPIMTSYKKKKTNEDMKRIIRLTENDLSRIVKRVLEEETEMLDIFNKGMRKYKPAIPNRTMVTSDENTNPTEKYPLVYYGYDKLKRKTVQATGNQRYGAVFHYCDATPPRDIKYDFVKISTQENPYETHQIDMTQQPISDARWLSSICDSIRWKPKKN